MAINPRAREPFDRERSFITVRPVLLGGTAVGPGQPFDKALVNLRRLRQLYDQRIIVMAPLTKTPAPTVKSTKLNSSALRAQLKAKGVIPRYGVSREKLLELAAQHGIAA